MNIERLQRLSSFLRHEIPPGQFRFDGYWFRALGTDDDVRCGTVACALGWACLIPEFRESGLHVVKGNFDQSYPEYGSSIGAYAAAEFFEITKVDACSIFNPTSENDYPGTHFRDVTQDMVADRIDALIAAERLSATEMAAVSDEVTA